VKFIGRSKKWQFFRQKSTAKSALRLWGTDELLDQQGLTAEREV